MKIKFIVFTLLCSLALSTFSILVISESNESEQPTIVETTPSGINIDNLSDEIDSYMEKYIGVTSPGAAVVVVKDGEIIYSGAYGMADIENNIPVSKDTVFEYASISKLFVWVSVMQLVEQGKLDLDADIRIYLPVEFNEKWKNTYTITMRNIMNHSSGYGEYPFDLFSSEDLMEVDLAQAILTTYPKQYYEPGTASSYSNYAVALAAYVVECISEKEFYEYEKEYIFDVLNMNQTAGHPYSIDNISILDNKAQGYRAGEKGFTNTGWSYISHYPAGSVNGTAEDLAKFVIALMPNEDTKSALFQNIDTTSLLLSSSYDEGSSGTAHGFFEYNFVTTPAFGHGGNTMSFSTQVVLVPQEQFGLIVLTNSAGELDITYGLCVLLIGSKNLDSMEIVQELPNIQNLAGTYVDIRRPEKTPLEFVSYLSTVSISVIGDNTIKLQKGPFSAEYVQISPYVFELVKCDNAIIRVNYHRLVFRMDNGTPTHILVGNGMDMSVLPAHRSSVYLLFSVIVAAISILFFLIYPVAIIISALKRRKKNDASNKKVVHVQDIASLSGTALVVNNIALIIYMIINQKAYYSQILPFIVLNYVIVIINVVLFAWGIVNFKKVKSKIQKVWFVVAGIILISFISILVNWNMFVLYI